MSVIAATVAIGAMTTLCLSSVTGAGQLYDFSLTAYRDVDRTDQYFIVTATVENAGAWKSSESGNSIYDFRFTDVIVDTGPIQVFSDTGNYSQNANGYQLRVWLSGLGSDGRDIFQYVPGQPDPTFGPPLFDMQASLEPFTTEAEISELRTYVDRLGTGILNPTTIHAMDVYTVASITAVPGPGATMIVALNGAVIGFRRRRRS